MEGPAARPSARERDSRTLGNVWLGMPPATPPAPEEAAAPTAVWRELAALALLLLLAAGMRAWLISHTEVAARDSIGFIRYALELERYPWKDVLAHSLQHPGYPAVLLAVSWPVRQFLGGTNCISMQLSAQLTSALAGVLLVIPMYYLGRDLLGRRAGFWGAALFQCLPVTARVLSDALSEATFLLFTALALWFAVRALRGRSVLRFAWCGLFGGLAYLTRPEGALVIAATGLVLLAMQFAAGWRRPWRQAFAAATVLLLTAFAVSSPYVLVIGRLTNKPTPRVLLETLTLEESPRPERSADPGMSDATGRKQAFPSFPGPLMASLLGIYAPEHLTDRRLWGLSAIATEVTKDFQYLSVVPLVLGLWWFRKRLAAVPSAWLLLVFCLLHALILWRLATLVGYVSDRHVLVLVLCGVFVAADGVFVLADGLARALRRFRAEGATAADPPASRRSLAWLILVFMAFGLQEASKPLHANRAGHRQAGLWLAEHTVPADLILDPFCWAHYYAGRVFWEGLTPVVPPGHTPMQYVVLEKSPTSEHSRLPTIHQAKTLAARGQVVYHWPLDKPEAEAKILVYAVLP